MTHSNPLFDLAYWDGEVNAVNREGEGWEIVFTYKNIDHLRLYISDERNTYHIEPKVGDHTRMYGNGFGWAVRGLALNGYTVYWESEDDYRKRIQR